MEEKFLFALEANRQKAEALGARIRPITDLQQAHRCLSGNRDSEGFGLLAQKGHLEWSLEALAIQKAYTALFTDEQVNNALLRLLEAISARQEVTVCCLSPHARRKEPLDIRIVPLRIFVSAQSGRQYCMAYNRQLRRIHSYRMDYILDVTPGEAAEDFGYLREKLDAMQTRMWGVSPAADDNPGGRAAETVTFTVEFSEKEEYIFTRLDREKRCGTVERVDNHHYLFSATVSDGGELIPWIRTFLCRYRNN